MPIASDGRGSSIGSAAIAAAASFASATSRRSTCREAAPSGVDPSTPDVVFPHPVYGCLGWLAVVDPGPRTEDALRDLLRTAPARARVRHDRRAMTPPRW
jgi:uncharacterized protein DUF6194